MNLTQKISQMTPKGADLAATDLIEVSTLEAGSYVTKSITGQELIDAIPLPPTGLTIGTTPISSGTIGRVLFQGTGNVLQQSSSLFWDNNKLIVGISGNAIPLVTPQLRVVNNTTGGDFEINGNGYARMFLNDYSQTTNNKYYEFLNLGGNFSISRLNDLNDIRTQRFTIFSTGNVGINTTTDAGFRLDVNGTARVQGNAQFGTGFYWDNTNARLGIGTSSPIDKLQANGALRLTGRTGIVEGVNQSALIDFVDTTIFATSPRTRIYAVGTPTIAAQMSFNVGLAGTPIEALRIFGTGNLGINTTTDAGFRLDVNGTVRFNGNLTFQTTNWVLDNGNAIMHRGGFNVESIAFNSSRMVFTDNNGFVFNGSNSSATLTASSILDIQSTTKGFLPPRMTTTQRNAIASPAAGLIVYDTTLNLPHFFNGTIWVSL